MTDVGTASTPSRLIRLAAPFRAALGAALNVALPPLCPACRELVGGNGLCASCWSKLSLIAPPYCERLGIPFVYDPGPGVLSMEAIADPPACHRAHAAVRYDEIARTLVHSLKYGDRLDLAPTAGQWMARAGRELLEGANALQRVKATPQQVGLSQKERASNVQGAFRVPPEGKAEVKGRRLVLVDDVLTSGATADGCARPCSAPAPATWT
jgi:predicted amidophosphoribosyltransferase